MGTMCRYDGCVGGCVSERDGCLVVGRGEEHISVPARPKPVPVRQNYLLLLNLITPAETVTNRAGSRWAWLWAIFKLSSLFFMFSSLCSS